MPQVPTAARKKRQRFPDDDDDEQQQEERRPRKPRVSLANKLLATVEPFPPGFLPRTDEERREVYLRIIRLRSIGKTYQQVADTLGLAEKTIRNYSKEPMYQELEGVLEADARQQGYHLISEMIFDSYETLYELMRYSSSDFVRYKCAAEILLHGGFGMPREEAQKNNRDEATKFVEEVRRRNQQQQQQAPVQVNVQINQVHAGGGETTTMAPHTVEGRSSTAMDSTDPSSLVLPAALDDDPLLLPGAASPMQYEPVLPGGKLPESFRTMKTAE